MDRELLAYLDEVGCKFGRDSRDIFLQCFKQTEVQDAALREKVLAFENNHKELWESIDRLTAEINHLKVKLAWILGFASMAGSILGSILTLLLRSLF